MVVLLFMQKAIVGFDLCGRENLDFDARSQTPVSWK